jgi:hypothetical protein
VVVIWTKEQENGIGETKGVWRGGWDHEEKRVSNDRYHYDQGEKGIQRDRSQIRVSEMVGSTKKMWVKNDRYHWNQGKERNPVG